MDKHGAFVRSDIDIDGFGWKPQVQKERRVLVQVHSAIDVVDGAQDLSVIDRAGIDEKQLAVAGRAAAAFDGRADPSAQARRRQQLTDSRVVRYVLDEGIGQGHILCVRAWQNWLQSTEQRRAIHLADRIPH